MAEITVLQGGGGGGGEDDEEESPYWSHDFGTDPHLPPSDLPSAEISATVEIFHRENQVNFVMDLFHQRLDQSQSPDPKLELELGLGFSAENHDLDDDDVDDFGCGFASADCGDEFFVWRRDSNVEPGESSVARRDSVFSDYDEDIDVVGIDLDHIFEDENVGDDDRSSVQICWDSLLLEEDQRQEREDFEWEEVDGMVDEREVMSMFFDADVDDDLDVSVAMEIPSEEELGMDQVRNLESEVILNIQNVDPSLDDDYEILVGQFAGTEALNPPASKGVVGSLPVVVVTKDDVDGEDALCAICKDDMRIGEKAKMLPCSHRYHGCCIEPWLGMRNTCPVCRRELPTDDPQYERRRVERASRA